MINLIIVVMEYSSCVSSGRKNSVEQIDSRQIPHPRIVGMMKQRLNNLLVNPRKRAYSALNHLKVCFGINFFALGHDAAAHFGTRAQMVATLIVLLLKDVPVVIGLIPQLDIILGVNAGSNRKTKE